jgi:hypothetical protein
MTGAPSPIRKMKICILSGSAFGISGWDAP